MFIIMQLLKPLKTLTMIKIHKVNFNSKKEIQHSHIRKIKARKLAGRDCQDILSLYFSGCLFFLRFLFPDRPKLI